MPREHWTEESPIPRPDVPSSRGKVPGLRPFRAPCNRPESLIQRTPDDCAEPLSGVEGPSPLRAGVAAANAGAGALATPARKAGSQVP